MAIPTKCPQCRSFDIRLQGDHGVVCNACGNRGQFSEWKADSLHQQSPVGLLMRAADAKTVYDFLKSVEITNYENECVSCCMPSGKGHKNDCVWSKVTEIMRLEVEDLSIVEYVSADHTNECASRVCGCGIMFDDCSHKLGRLPCDCVTSATGG